MKGARIVLCNYISHDEVILRVKLELVIINLLPKMNYFIYFTNLLHGGPSRPRQNCHSCIFETKENSNFRIWIQYLGHHSKTTCQKSAKSMGYRVRPKFEFYRKSLLKRTDSLRHISIFPKYCNISLTVWSMDCFCSLYINWESWILLDISTRLKLAKINPMIQTVVSTIKWIIACTERQILT